LLVCLHGGYTKILFAHDTFPFMISEYMVSHNIFSGYNVCDKLLHAIHNSVITKEEIPCMSLKICIVPYLLWRCSKFLPCHPFEIYASRATTNNLSIEHREMAPEKTKTPLHVSFLMVRPYLFLCTVVLYIVHLVIHLTSVPQAF
jgi:hypothetical protein